MKHVTLTRLCIYGKLTSKESWFWCSTCHYEVSPNFLVQLNLTFHSIETLSVNSSADNYWAWSYNWKRFNFVYNKRLDGPPREESPCELPSFERNFLAPPSLQSTLSPFVAPVHTAAGRLPTSPVRLQGAGLQGNSTLSSRFAPGSSASWRWRQSSKWERMLHLGSLNDLWRNGRWDLHKLTGHGHEQLESYS